MSGVKGYYSLRAEETRGMAEQCETCGTFLDELGNCPECGR